MIHQLNEMFCMRSRKSRFGKKCNKCGRSLTELSVDFFLEQNKNFLVGMGIFGALTMYLTQLSANETVNNLMPIFKTSLGKFSWFDLGVSASLLIFLSFLLDLVSYLPYFPLIQPFSNLTIERERFVTLDDQQLCFFKNFPALKAGFETG